MRSTLIGQDAPDFTLPKSNGGSLSLSDLDGQWKVIFFYARDGSPVCKRGCLSFKEQYDLFQSLIPPVQIIAISQDSVKDHEIFINKLNLPFDILSDKGLAVTKSYGVPLFLGKFPALSAFVIGPDRKIHHCYDWLFRPRNHVAKILAAMSDVTERGDFK